LTINFLCITSQSKFENGTSNCELVIAKVKRWRWLQNFNGRLHKFNKRTKETITVCWCCKYFPNI